MGFVDKFKNIFNPEREPASQYGVVSNSVGIKNTGRNCTSKTGWAEADTSKPAKRYPERTTRHNPGLITIEGEGGAIPNPNNPSSASKGWAEADTSKPAKRYPERTTRHNSGLITIEGEGGPILHP